MDDTNKFNSSVEIMKTKDFDENKESFEKSLVKHQYHLSAETAGLVMKSNSRDRE